MKKLPYLKGKNILNQNGNFFWNILYLQMDRKIIVFASIMWRGARVTYIACKDKNCSLFELRAAIKHLKVLKCSESIWGATK